MQGEKFDLTWNDFGRNAERLFRNLANDSLFTDVTLISDDRKRIKAHKVILSSCSNFFHQILIETSTENPLLFLKGIQHRELLAIVNFIYNGTTEVSHEHLSNFMKAAGDLHIEGLQEKKSSADINKYDVDYQELNTKEHEDSYHQPDTKQQGFAVALNENLKNSSIVLPQFKNQYFERNHDGSYMCDECEYKTTSIGNLKAHRLGKHEGIKFKCAQCPREFSAKSNLQAHIHSIHEGKIYTCEQCPMEFTRTTKLSEHKAKYHRYV